MENCDITSVISALFEVIKEFQEKNKKNLTMLANKCLVKTTDNLSQNINNIKIHQILLQIHLLLISLQKKNPNLTIKYEIDTMIINNVKTIVENFAKLKKKSIWDEYSKSVKNHQLKDKFLYKWIKEALNEV